MFARWDRTSDLFARMTAGPSGLVNRCESEHTTRRDRARNPGEGRWFEARR